MKLGTPNAITCNDTLPNHHQNLPVSFSQNRLHFLDKREFWQLQGVVERTGGLLGHFKEAEWKGGVEKMKRWEVIASIIDRGKMRRESGGKKMGRRGIKSTPCGFKRSSMISMQSGSSGMDTLYPPAFLFVIFFMAVCWHTFFILRSHIFTLLLSVWNCQHSPEKKCKFLTGWRGQKSEMSICFRGSSSLWPVCTSPLYRSCIVDTWIHKWLTLS